MSVEFCCDSTYSIIEDTINFFVPFWLFKYFSTQWAIFFSLILSYIYLKQPLTKLFKSLQMLNWSVSYTLIIFEIISFLQILLQKYQLTLKNICPRSMSSIILKWTTEPKYVILKIKLKTTGVDKNACHTILHYEKMLVIQFYIPKQNC